MGRAAGCHAAGQSPQRTLGASLRPFDGIRVLANIGIMVRACVRACVMIHTCIQCNASMSWYYIRGGYSQKGVYESSIAKSDAFIHMHIYYTLY